MTFNNVTVNKGAATAALTIVVTDTLIVAGTTTLTNGEIDTGTGTGSAGKLRVDGTVSIAAGFDGGTGVLELNVATGLTPAAGAVLPGVTFTNAGSSFTGPGSGTVTFEGPVDLVASTFNAGAGTIAFEDDLLQPSGSTFNHNSGTVIFQFGSAKTVNVNGSLTLNNLTIATSAIVNVDATDELVVIGLLTLTDGTLNDGVIEQQGTFSLGSTFDGGDGQVEFNTLQNIVMANGSKLPGVELLVSGSSITGAGASTTNSFGADIILTTGTTFNAGAGTVTIDQGGIDTSAGGTFNHDSGTIFLADGSSTIPGVHTFRGNLTFNNLTNSFAVDTEVIFDDSYTFTIVGDLRFDVDGGEGDPNDRAYITIESDNPGSAATIDVQDANPFVFGAIVQDINNIGTTVYCVVQCTDNGNNTGWYFGQPAVLVSDISGNTTEAGGTATFTVELRNEPLDDVTVAVVSSDTTEGTVSSPSLTFTSANWDTPQIVTVTGANDADNDGGIEFTIDLGPAASVGDSGYDALTVPSVTVINEDNDAAGGGDGMDFEDPANFTYENIAEQAGITWFEHDFYATGFLMTDEFGVEVDLSGTGVKAGCRIDVGGTEWIISTVNPDQVGYIGYIMLTDDPSSRVEDLDVTLVSGPVTYIECARAGAGGLEFQTDDLVGVRGSTDPALESTSYTMVYDSAADTIWFDAPPTRVDLTDLTFDVFTRQSGFEPKMALDPSRGEIWYPNHTSDTITKFDTTTGTATHYATADNCESAEYDPVNDKMWVLCSMTSGVADALLRMNPADGTILSTIPIESDGSTGSFTTNGLVYDDFNDRIWAITDGGQTIVAVDADTGAYSFGTLAASTFDTYHVESSFGNVRTPHYVEETNTVWVLNAQCDGFGDIVTVLDAATGSPVGFIDVPSCPISSAIDPLTDTIWYSSDLEGTLTEVRMADNTVVEMHRGIYFSTASYPVAVDGEGDIWTIDCCDPGMYEFVRNGVPYNAYYTTVSNDNAQIDTSAWTGIDTTTINETLDGQSIFYTVSFDDRHTFKVWGSDRPIASDEAAIHGGVDGDWYYRDNASTWTPAPSNTQEEAISLAVAAGANNQMDSTDLAALTSTDWETLGFDPGVTTTMDISATMYTTDPHDAPSVQSIAFTTGAAPASGGGGSSGSFVSNGSISIDAGSACTPDTAVTLSLGATGADDMLVSNQSDLADASWESFATSKAWTLNGTDGTQTVYVKFRSVDHNVTTVYTDSIVLDQAGDCTDVVEEPEPVVEEPVEDTPDTDVSPAPAVYSSDDFVRGEGDDTVYYVSADGSLRPFSDIATYLTYAGVCGTFTTVTPETIVAASVGSPMLPNPGTTLVKFADSSKVYAVESAANPELVVLRWIVSEEVARTVYGADWDEYVLGINPAPGTYLFGADITGAEAGIDPTRLMSRAALTGAASYNVYIINPDGTRRDSYSIWTRVVTRSDGRIVFNFEDKGSDFDYNDVVVDVDPSSCTTFTFRVYPLEAAWHHQIGLQVSYEGELKGDLLLWDDSHEAVNQEKTVDITYAPAFEASIETRYLASVSAASAALFQPIRAAMDGMGIVF